MSTADDAEDIAQPARKKGETAPFEAAEERRRRIADGLKRHIRGLVGQLFPHAEIRGHEARIGDVSGARGSSLSIELDGERAGFWRDHATDEGGDAFDLWAAVHRLDVKRDFARILTEAGQWLGGDYQLQPRQPDPKKPTSARRPNVVARYPYHSASGELLFEVRRVEFLDETGATIMKDGGKAEKEYWPRQPDKTPGYPPGLRALYRLPDIDGTDEVIFCEGEKKADALHSCGWVASSAPGGAKTKLDAIDFRPLAGKTVLLWPDNDDVGRDFMASVGARLLRLGCKVSVVEIPADVPAKWDAADAVAEERDIALILARAQPIEARDGVEDEKSPLPSPTAWRWAEPKVIRPRRWLYGRQLARGVVSVTVAPGGVGKSTLSLAEAVAMATGRPLLHQRTMTGPRRVWFYNLEDPQEELDRRLAAVCMHYRVTERELGDRLYVNSGLKTPLVTASLNSKGKIVLDEPLFQHLEARIRAEKIDVIIIDPFISSHELPENDNTSIDKIAKRWARLADSCDIAVAIVHHTKKTAGQEVDAESSRGASALGNAARIVRVINQMSKDEASQAGLPEEHRRLYFRLSRDKQNLGPPETDKNWFQMVGVPLGNATEDYPEGDDVGVPTRWQFPSAFDGIEVADLRAVQEQIQSGDYAQNVQAGHNWAGHAIGKVIGVDTLTKGGKARAQRLLKTWTDSGALRVEAIHDQRNGRSKPMIRVGEWAPKEVVPHS